MDIEVDRLARLLIATRAAPIPIIGGLNNPVPFLYRTNDAARSRKSYIATCERPDFFWGMRKTVDARTE